MTESRESQPQLGGLLAAQFFGAFNDNAMKLMVALLAAAAATVGLADTDSVGRELATQEQLMIATVVFTLPLMVFSLPSALIADRYSKRSIILATKVTGEGLSWVQDGVDISPTKIRISVEGSLKRLQTDYIDLYIIHWPDLHTPLETTWAALDQIVRQGKVRYLGVSNHSASQLCEILWLADRNGWARPVASQIPFSLLRREFQNDLEFCERHALGVTPYQSLQGGLLTGKYRRGADVPSDSRAAEKPAWMWERNDAMFDQLEGLQELASELNVTPARYALAWALGQQAMSSLIVGVKRLEQIEEAVSAAEVCLPAEHGQRIDQLFAPPWKQPDPIRG